MRNKRILTSAVLATALAVVGTTAFAQTPVIQNRVAQPVAINGTRVDAAYVLAPGGGIQSYSCPAPQQYATLDGATQGWACFDAATNVWLLSALPPQQQAPAPAPVVQQVYQPPVYQQPVVYTVAQPTIIYSEPGPYFYGYGSVYPRYYSPSVAFGVASINAGGRIAASIIESSRFRGDFRDGHGSVRVESRGGGHRR